MLNNRLRKENFINLGVNRINVNMEKVLSNPPGHSVNRKVFENYIELAYEASMSKLRWKNMEDEYKKLDDKVSNYVNINYSHSEKVINFNNMRASEMKCNKRVTTVESFDIEFETKLSNLKKNVLKHLKIGNVYLIIKSSVT